MPIWLLFGALDTSRFLSMIKTTALFIQKRFFNWNWIFVILVFLQIFLPTLMETWSQFTCRALQLESFTVFDAFLVATHSQYSNFFFLKKFLLYNRKIGLEGCKKILLQPMVIRYSLLIKTKKSSNLYDVGSSESHSITVTWPIYITNLCMLRSSKIRPLILNRL